MSDDLIFREVDEELRQEQLARLWKAYGTYIVAVAVLIVVGVAGYKGWTWYQTKRAAESGARLEAALRLAEEGKEGEALGSLDELIRSGSGGYPRLARFAAAAAKARSGNRAGALADYEALAGEARDPLVKDLARLRAAQIAVDTEDHASIQSRLAGITADDNPWRNSAWEILGLSAYRAGDMDAAAHAFETIIADLSAFPEVRQRAEMMLTLITPARGTAGAPGGAAAP